MPRITLPDGVGILAVSDFEARLLYREIVEDGTYLKHGITLPAGARVFDVGANVGVFALHVARMTRDARIRSFEPIPTTFAMLRQNLAEHVPGAVAIQAALGAHAGTAVFEFEPSSSITASMTPAAFAGASIQNASRTQWMAAAAADLARVDRGAVAQWLAGAFNRWWTRPLAIAMLTVAGSGLALRKRLTLRRQSCPVGTLSAELAASGFDAIDLVKIDVEGAEEDVLRGIGNDDWPRIRQFVIEVHDVDGRIERISAQLRARGYHVVLDREDWALHELMGISTLYAMRRDTGSV
jgi:31-O-methyltransferase